MNPPPPLPSSGPPQRAPLHPVCEPLAVLLGSWRGEGAGVYPTITSFRYREEVRFWHTGKPWLGYEQKTWGLESGEPMHSESGFWRPQSDGRIEVVLAHAFGVVEILEGVIQGTTIDLKSTVLASSSSAKEIQRSTRVVSIEGEVLAYALEMQTQGQELQGHLTAELRRVEEPTGAGLRAGASIDAG